MDELRSLKLLGTIDALLIPIQKVISAILPDYLEEALDQDDVREAIVAAADKALLTAAPEARLVPEAMRKRIIRKSLDLILDEIVLS
ncbi:hypothetical protein [Desulfogranum marinum]|uniref:hypothetical protein n=1 Tax=Desulfogranum marinum TaxID=453220 RepID=UPI0029C74C2E|nr:hypothetical protein [Desulfogranum marinum]